MSTPIFAAGKQGERLPEGENVLRLLKKTTKDGNVSPDEFELSTQDKNSALQSVSVWAEQLTTPEQAREFMGDKKDAYSWYCSLRVDTIRALRPTPEDTAVRPLDVVWDPLTLVVAGREEGELLGVEGHCGITGLMRPPGLPKIYFFSLRSQLADLSTATLANIK